MTTTADRPLANCLTDVVGLAVGHHQRTGRGWRTGTTVALLPPGSVVGVDVRGGGPGTRETDLLDPLSTISTAHAICLTGGSAYGLAAAQGVMTVLEQRGIGFEVGRPQTPDHGVVPLVPAAVIFDLARGGTFAHRPDASFGERATRSARTTPSPNGTVGAGTGARAGGLQGGLGTASATLTLDDGDREVVVAALVVVNSVGTVIDPSTGVPWERGDDLLGAPTDRQRAALARTADAARPPLNTTIGIVATTALLSKAESTKLAAVGHAGLAPAIRPAPGLFDGDTLFGVATGRDDLTGDTTRRRTARLDAVLAAAAQCVARACTNAVVRADGPNSYRALCPSAFRPT
ncbi:MAG: P1 family peptidase, partial [Ilumatobacteraceae bacterium]